MTSVADLIAPAAQRYGQDPAVLLRLGQIESGLNPSAINRSSGASGLFQFTPSTARAYGLANPQDPAASADAAARLLRDNAAYLTKALGRAPSGAELYLAHQQGMGGAAKLLAHPDAPAASLVGTKAVIQNGGTQGMTARQFADMWTAKYNGVKAPAANSVASLYASGAAPPSSGGLPTLPPLPGPNPGGALAAMAPTGEDGLTQMPQRAPTVSNGGVDARRRALITGQGGLGAMFE